MARVKINRRGARAVLRSTQVEAHLRQIADKIDAAAGSGHAVDSQIGRERARASVRTITPAAKAAQATDRNLTKALDAGRI